MMQSNDFSGIAHSRFPHLSGPVSWAKLGEFACAQLKHAFAAVRDDSDLKDAVAHANTLAARLQARDRVKGARTTRELREAIMSLSSLASLLDELSDIRSGRKQPTHDSGARATVIRQRWSKAVGVPTPWVKRLVEEAVSHVLASGASAGIKSLYTKAQATFLPPPPSSPRGEQMTWDSDFDDE